MSLVDTETGEVVELLSEDDARDLTDRIVSNLEVTWDLVVECYQRRAWDALGYDSWNHYCTQEFGASAIRLPKEDRREAVASLRDAGLSTRAIAAATGAARNTVRSDLKQVGQSDPPDRNEVEPNFGNKVKGVDGKSYAKTTDRKGESTTTETPTKPVGTDAVDLAAERTARSDAAYRENLSKARVKALELTLLDTERCAAVLPVDDRDSELRFVERMTEWFDAYQSALTDKRLRSVK